jgi:hypothetical protein
MIEARRSKRPSRADRPAGTTSQPDHVLSESGFTELLKRVLIRARAPQDLPSAIAVLLTLDGHLSEEDGLRALAREEAVAVAVLRRSARPDPAAPHGQDPAGDAPPPAGPVFTSALALDPHGKLVVTAPGRRALPPAAAATGVALRVAWTAADMTEYRRAAAAARAEDEREIAQCRALLDDLGEEGRADAVDALRAAVFLVPPVLFHHDGSVYSNLRSEPGNLTGKTLLPTHPDCFFHHLDELPLELWTDAEAVVVTCLYLLHRSGGPNRLESSNGHQLTLRNVQDNLRAQHATYGADAPPAPSWTRPLDAATLLSIADGLARVRARLVEERALHYEINATTRRKVEKRFAVLADEKHAERFVCERLEGLLPHEPHDYDSVIEMLRHDPALLAAPAAGQPTGFEAMIHATVGCALELLDADFAMSRGIRSLPRLVDRLRAHDWEEIVSWDLPAFYCCVVPSRAALAVFAGDHAALADSAWAIAARMQYNTWHVMPGNLPKDPSVVARDFLAPHVLPDVAVHSDLHHRGHVANRIRFSARSPETVLVAGNRFKSLTDIRVLRCVGPAFDERELVSVTRMARFLARLSEVVADHAAAGVQYVEVTSFDHRWHHRTIIEERLGSRA